MSDAEVQNALNEHKIGLTIEEAREIEKILKRPPTVTEAILWGIQGSEHCSYKSSRRYLKLLPTKAPNVVLGVGEDAGIVEIAKITTKKKDSKGKAIQDRYGLIVGHESHNHPSQIVPFEGAATGIGGCIRDIACMGGRVLGVMDPLRLGNIKENQPRQIFNGVVSGIAGYGNPVGIPNLGGDIYFDPSYNDNCLVNVVAVGMVKESDIIHSYVPKNAAKENWDIIVVGKPTDFSGMGGAAFASGILKESEKEKNKGAVQEPNPFLKRHILVSTYDLFETLQKQGLIDKVSFKDMGAGGVTCSTVEQVAKAGFGAEIDLEKVHVGIKDLPPSVIACSETQERFTWMCHPSITQMILDHYNKKWDLPAVAENARASHIGKVKEGNFVLYYKGEKVVDATSESITEGLSYDRPHKAAKKSFKEPDLEELLKDDGLLQSSNKTSGAQSPQAFGKASGTQSAQSSIRAGGAWNKIMLDLLSSENIAHRKPVYERYDKQVQGYVIIEAGMADAGVIAPLMDEPVDAKTKKIGMALSTDFNPRYALISAYHGAANAVVESMRNVAAVGAYPQALTDCLNYGNPEKPEQMEELIEGITGIKDACEGIKLKNYVGYATPIISGNVSLYNEGKGGHVPPSAVMCCIGKIDNYEKAITTQFKKAGSKIYMIGERKNELGGSEYYRLHGELGANVPQADFAQVQREIYTMVDAVAAGLVNAAHDISEGGLAVAVAEMAFGGRGEGQIGAEVDLAKVAVAGAPAAAGGAQVSLAKAPVTGKLAANMAADMVIASNKQAVQTSSANAKTQSLTTSLAAENVIKLFSETGGFVLEVSPEKAKKLQALCERNNLAIYEIGKTTKAPILRFKNRSKSGTGAKAGQDECIIDLPLLQAAERWTNGLREKM
jgi:phosphoribosylformylglycinamidine synthase